MPAQALISVLALLATAGGCSSMPQYPVSDHYDGKRFFNPWGANVDKGFWDVLKWRLGSSPVPWPKEEVVNTAKPDLQASAGTPQLRVTYVGHATTYIQDGKRSILTDPVFSHRVSPVSFAGPTRARKPLPALEDLPGVDFVVVSHNHYDHMDLPSLAALDRKFHPLFIVPLGNARILKGEGIERIVELDWWQSHESIQLVPVQHWSARGLGDRNEALWGGYVLTVADGRKVFFAGDTGYGPHFKMIREKLGPVDLALLPIGAYEPRWFMKMQHMNPEDAVNAHRDLEARQSLAIHFETLRLTDEAFEEPRTLLREALDVAKIPEAAFLAPQVGQTWVVSQ